MLQKHDLPTFAAWSCGVQKPTLVGYYRSLRTLLERERCKFVKDRVIKYWHLRHELARVKLVLEHLEARCGNQLR
jgi:hypothetical protein